MNKGRLGAALILIISLGSVALPSPSVYSLPAQMIPPISSGVYSHYFRQYLKSTPAGSTTVNHYLFQSLSWMSQICVGYVHFLILVSAVVGQTSIQHMYKTRPDFVCTVLSPYFIVVPFALHFSAMTGIKFFMAVQPERLLRVNQEKLWRCLQLTCLGITVTDLASRMIMNSGSLCHPGIAIRMSKTYLGINQPNEYFDEEKFVNLPTPLIFLLLACFNYLAAIMIKKFLPNKSSPAVPHIQIEPQEQDSNSSKPNLADAMPTKEQTTGFNTVIGDPETLVSVEEPTVKQPDSNSMTLAYNERKLNMIEVVPMHYDNTGTPLALESKFQPYKDDATQFSMIVEPTSSLQGSKTTTPQGQMSFRELASKIICEPIEPQIMLAESALSSPEPRSDVRTDNTRGEEPQSSKKVLRSLHFIGFVILVSITFLLVMLILLGLRIECGIHKLMHKFIVVILEWLPVIWINCIPDASDLMHRRLKAVFRV